MHLPLAQAQWLRRAGRGGLGAEAQRGSRARSDCFSLLFSYGAVKEALGQREPRSGSSSVLTATQGRVGYGGARVLGHGGPRPWPELLLAAGGDGRRVAAAGGWKRGEREESS